MKQKYFKKAKYQVNKGCSYFGMDVGLESMKGAIDDDFIDSGTFLYLDACKERFPFVDDFFWYLNEKMKEINYPRDISKELKI